MHTSGCHVLGSHHRGQRVAEQQHPQSQKADVGAKTFPICRRILRDHKGRRVRMDTTYNGTVHWDDLKVKKYNDKCMQTQLSPYVISPVEASLPKLSWKCICKFVSCKYAYVNMHHDLLWSIISALLVGIKPLLSNNLYIGFLLILLSGLPHNFAYQCQHCHTTE